MFGELAPDSTATDGFFEMVRRMAPVDGLPPPVLGSESGMYISIHVTKPTRSELTVVLQITNCVGQDLNFVGDSLDLIHGDFLNVVREGKDEIQARDRPPPTTLLLPYVFPPTVHKKYLHPLTSPSRWSRISNKATLHRTLDVFHYYPDIVEGLQAGDWIRIGLKMEEFVWLSQEQMDSLTCGEMEIVENVQHAPIFCESVRIRVE